MGTKNNPGEFDCYAAADPDEEMFILLARDSFAPDIIEEWCRRRAIRARREKDPAEGERQMRKIDEAFACAQRMRDQGQLIQQGLPLKKGT